MYLVAGAAIGCLLYHLMRVCRVHQAIAFTLAALFITSPGVVLYENFFLHEYLVVFLLLVAAAAVYHFFSSQKTVYAAVFFCCIFLLFLIRSHFHLVYVLLMSASLWYCAKAKRRAIFIAGLLPLILAAALCFKNWMLFHSFSSSTWMALNMDVITSHQLTPQEAHTLIRAGIISPVSLIDTGAPIAAYAPYVVPPPPTGIPVLDEQVTSTGATNFNNPVFLAIGRYYIQDGLAILRHYPRAYLRSLQKAWFAYFLPTSDFPFFDLNRRKIRRIDRFYNVVFFGQWKDASDRKNLRAMQESGHQFGLILYTGTFLIAGLPLLWAGGIYYLILGVRRHKLDRPTAALLGFLLFNITYLTAVANFLSSFENNRYRFQIDGFFLILLAVAAEQARRRLVTTLPTLRAARYWWLHKRNKKSRPATTSLRRTHSKSWMEPPTIRQSTSDRWKAWFVHWRWFPAIPFRPRRWWCFETLDGPFPRLYPRSRWSQSK